MHVLSVGKHTCAATLLMHTCAHICAYLPHLIFCPLHSSPLSSASFCLSEYLCNLRVYFESCPDRGGEGRGGWCFLACLAINATFQYRCCRGPQAADANRPPVGQAGGSWKLLHVVHTRMYHEFGMCLCCRRGLSSLWHSASG